VAPAAPTMATAAAAISPGTHLGPPRSAPATAAADSRGGRRTPPPAAGRPTTPRRPDEGFTSRRCGGRGNIGRTISAARRIPVAVGIFASPVGRPLAAAPAARGLGAGHLRAGGSASARRLGSSIGTRACCVPTTPPPRVRRQPCAPRASPFGQRRRRRRRPSTLWRCRAAARPSPAVASPVVRRLLLR